MSERGSLFDGLVAAREISSPSQHIFDEIEKAMAPFKLGIVTLSVESPFAFEDHEEHTVVVEVERFPETPFKQVVRIGDFYTSYDFHITSRRIGKKAGAFFRNIYIPPSKNHILGED